MTSHIQLPYKFRASQGGIFVEIFLPKKPSFQGTLYDTLVKGFRIENVKQHFLSNKLERIKNMLADMDEARFLDDPSAIAAYPSVLHGYSMFEVEGVFYNSRRDEIQNELTQVLRIMFKPDLSEMERKYEGVKSARLIINRTCKSYLRSRKDKPFPKDPKLTKPQRLMQSEVVDFLRKWTDYVGVFLFGFIVYEMCEQITKLCSEGVMKWDDAEDEIWVTHFWNLNINSIKLIRPFEKPQT